MEGVCTCVCARARLCFCHLFFFVFTFHAGATHADLKKKKKKITLIGDRSQVPPTVTKQDNANRAYHMTLTASTDVLSVLNLLLKTVSANYSVTR